MKIRYIKLGNGGEWEKNCIEEDNTIRLGYSSNLHQECINKNWEAVRQYWLKYRKNDKGASTRDINQIRDFYELSPSDIWITFYKKRLYWCHADKEVLELPDGSRIRNVLGKWSCHDKCGAILAEENLDGRITQLKGYRGTICETKLPDYILRKISGDIHLEADYATTALNQLKIHIQSLIKGLWWKDFELLIDLIFAKSGWQRVSVLGKTEKDIDLDIFSYITNKRAFVQIKSSTTVDELNKYYLKFLEYDQYNEAFLVFHTISGKSEILDDRVHLWDLERIADLVIQAGLIDWLITKRR